MSQLIAVETDPVAALMLGATAEAKGFSDRLTLKLTDYAAAPKGYTRRKGNLIDPRAARYGTRWHEGAEHWEATEEALWEIR